ncbi:DUF2147 domain-containing protein [Chryseobacterium sp. JJR-5R]|uniref:DUF2147 domain-containing protein n=1 Tax=Chryseobacterium sp. JJR-5R TaxID=3093923 RepID=UPI002A759188|nr:DUF2147 domain-containing protein [Chryseobacterium sp. JJR-5R]WPO82075.1 DUF2147 domain-containing protein [Chryseobacterium sp. JJR-5R]
MKKLLLTFVLSLFGVMSFAQIEGKWKTIDDETKQAKSIVEIYKKGDQYYGKISQLLIKPASSTCTECKDDRKGKPILGLEIIRGLKKESDEFTGGTITDPKSGKTYKCTITKSGDKLNVRGYVGVSMFGRSQTWQKVN